MTISPCLNINTGQDLACIRDDNHKHQLAVVYAFANAPETLIDAESYEVIRIVKSYKKPIASLRFTAPIIGNSIKGSYKKSEDKFGYAEYLHEVDILISAETEVEKSQIHALNNKLVRIVLFNSNRSAEMYGIHYGLKSGNYSYTGGAQVVKFTSIAKEKVMPMAYLKDKLGEELIENAFKIFDETFDTTFE